MRLEYPVAILSLVVVVAEILTLVLLMLRMLRTFSFDVKTLLNPPYRVELDEMTKLSMSESYSKQTSEVLMKGLKCSTFNPFMST